ncbi:MAG: hypothetical protein OXG05_00935 [Gammaproteobacteria bacterium]|nr:hypothetical protein [Gammaproteobacteria bacterium]
MASLRIYTRSFWTSMAVVFFASSSYLNISAQDTDADEEEADEVTEEVVVYGHAAIPRPKEAG